MSYSSTRASSKAASDCDTTADDGQFVQTELLTCAHILLYHSGISGILFIGELDALELGYDRLAIPATSSIGVLSSLLDQCDRLSWLSYRP